jgi:hypothetical protein
MSLQRQKHLEECKKWFSLLDREFEFNSAIRHLDANIEIENFFRDLLNLVYGWKLSNANWLVKTNQDSFDLADQEHRVAVQVTSTTSSEKIRKTLGKFIGAHSAQFDRLVFVYPCRLKSPTRADFTKQLSGYDFSPSRDQLDLKKLLQAIQNLGVPYQLAVVEFLQRELEPLRLAPDEVVSEKRVALFRRVLKLLDENRTVHSVYGPDSATSRRDYFGEGATIWKKKKASVIIPNNQKIVKLMEDNESLIDQDTWRHFLDFKLHSEAFKTSAHSPLSRGLQPRFPAHFESALRKQVRGNGGPQPENP